MIENLDIIFPTKQFCIKMDEEEMEMVLKNTSKIILVIYCQCYNCIKKKKKFLEVRAEDDISVKVKDAIRTLVDNNYKPKCSSIILEGFKQLSEDFFLVEFT